MNAGSDDTAKTLASRAWALPVCLLWGAYFWRASFFWGSEGYYFLAWLVPPLALYFLWTRMKDAPPASEPSQSARLLTVVAALCALGALFLGETMPFWRPLLYLQALWTVVASLALFAAVGGRSWLRHFLPVGLFVLIALPWAESIEGPAIAHLTQTIANLTETALNLLGYAAVATGNRIEIQGHIVEVGDACSGIRSFQGLFMIGLVVGELYRLRWGRLVLVGAAFLISFPLNVLRALILSLIVVDSGWEAYDTWHDPLGGIVYAVGCTTLLALAMLLTRAGLRRPAVDHGAKRSLEARPQWILALLIVLLFASIQAWFWIHQRPVERALAWELRSPDEATVPDARSVLLDPQVYELLLFDEGRHYQVLSAEGRKIEFFDFLYRQGTRGLLVTEYHTPEICMARSSDGTVEEKRFGIPRRFGDRQVHVTGYHISYPNGRRMYAFQGVWIAGGDDDGVARYQSLVLPAHNKSDRIRTAARRALAGRRDFPVQVFLLATEEAENLDQAWEMSNAVLDQFLQSASMD